MLIAIDSVVIGSGRRKTTRENVANLIKSIALIGLQTPISVLPANAAGKYPLVAGRHRLEACGKLGHTEIEARVIKDKVSAELWEIAENLHRSELTVMQRSLSIGRWIKLTAEQIAKGQNGGVSVQLGPKLVRNKGRPESGTSAAARELGITETTAKRAVKIATELTKTAQREAEKLGLADNQRALERAAGVPGAKEQVRALRRTVAEQEERKDTKARIAKNLAGTSPAKTMRQKLDRFYQALDVVERLEFRIWMLGPDAEAWAEQAAKLDEMLARDKGSLH